MTVKEKIIHELDKLDEAELEDFYQMVEQFLDSRRLKAAPFDTSGLETRPFTAAQKQMAAAAKLLLADYETDEELTAFTALDGEAFHA
jgi:hypothetical protein